MGRQTLVVSVDKPELLNSILVKAVQARLHYFDAAAGEWRSPSKKVKRVKGKIEVTFDADNTSALSILRNFTDDLNRGRADVKVTYLSPLVLPKAA